jgi:hypothetical protein
MKSEYNINKLKITGLNQLKILIFILKMSTFDLIQLFMKVYFKFCDHCQFNKYDDIEVSKFVDHFTADSFKSSEMEKYVNKTFSGGKKNYNKRIEFQFLNYLDLKLEEFLGKYKYQNYINLVHNIFPKKKYNKRTPFLIRFLTLIRVTEFHELLAQTLRGLPLLTSCCLYLINKKEFKDPLEKFHYLSDTELNISAMYSCFSFIFKQFFYGKLNSINILENDCNLNFLSLLNKDSLSEQLYITKKYFLIKTLKIALFASNTNDFDYLLFLKEFLPLINVQELNLHVPNTVKNFLNEVKMLRNLISGNLKYLELNSLKIHHNFDFITITFKEAPKEIDIMNLCKYFLILFTHLTPFFWSKLIKLEIDQKKVKNVLFFYMIFDLTKKIKKNKNRALSLINSFLGKSSFTTKYLLNKKYFLNQNDLIQLDDLNYFSKYFNLEKASSFKREEENIKWNNLKDGQFCWVYRWHSIKNFHDNSVIKSTKNNIIYYCEEKSGKGIINFLKQFHQKLSYLTFDIFLKLEELDLNIISENFHLFNYLIFQIENIIIIKNEKSIRVGYHILKGEEKFPNEFYLGILKKIILNYKIEEYFISGIQNYCDCLVKLEERGFSVFKIQDNKFQNKIAEGSFENQNNWLIRIKDVITCEKIKFKFSKLFSLTSEMGLNLIIDSGLLSYIQIHQKYLSNFVFNKLYIVSTIPWDISFNKMDTVQSINIFKVVIYLKYNWYLEEKESKFNEKFWLDQVKNDIDKKIKTENPLSIFPKLTNFDILYFILKLKGQKISNIKHIKLLVTRFFGFKYYNCQGISYFFYY